jgi:hypothetical protein
MGTKHMTLNWIPNQEKNYDIKYNLEPGTVVHACNPSYLEDRGKRI